MARTKTIYLPSGRLRAWADKFAADHGDPKCEVNSPRLGAGVVLSCPDGFAVRLGLPWEQLTPGLSADPRLRQLAEVARELAGIKAVILWPAAGL